MQATSVMKVMGIVMAMAWMMMEMDGKMMVIMIWMGIELWAKLLRHLTIDYSM